MQKFTVGNVQVKPGDWVYASQANGQILFAKICDNKFEGGCMVFWYNTGYPNGYEAGWMSPEQAQSFRRVREWGQKQFDKDAIGIAANKFFKTAKAGNFQ